MNIALIGYGRMGKEVERQAQDRGHAITAVFDVGDQFCSESNCHGADVLISFVTADVVIPNLTSIAKMGLPVVEGTTGWFDSLETAKKIPDLTMIYSANFSVGVYQFIRLVGLAAEMMGSLPEYDCCIHEFHHRGKVDSPSGTAKQLARVILENLAHKEYPLYDTSHGMIDQKALHVTSTRFGRVPGTHQVGFDSPADEIVLSHVAHGREGFALGAVRAAEWLIGRRGIFSMDDLMNDILNIKSV
ncbi:MAG: 4-hydroxy-tetrahydrodipicolinate reductase [Calditrichaeota bacterium]|nr:MAG: 4-hydroxy-tetrahydrodipicolinate reductase [Calditrichota bacterium]